MNREEQIKCELEKAQEAPWVRQMREHFNKTGSYRAEDLYRLLGDPIKGVELSANPSAMKNALTDS